MERKYKGQFNSVEKSVIEIVSWFGALILIIAPFFRDISTTSFHMILGLSLLTIQAIDEQLFNLILLNICGIFGWSLKLKKEREIEKARLG
jgi:hypothetical protein